MTGFQIFYASNAFIWFLLFFAVNNRETSDDRKRTVIYAIWATLAFARALYEFS